MNLTAVCGAWPAQVGLIVIGREGALALGGLAVVATPQLPPAGTCLYDAAPNVLTLAIWSATAVPIRRWPARRVNSACQRR